MSGSGAVAFNYQAWVTRYPEFASIDAPTAALYFAEAGLYLDNSATSLVTDGPTRLMLLNMITAHIAQLNRVVNGAAASDLVGRIDSATQGSVSVTAVMDTVPGTAAWFVQTKYGAAYWQATAAYRTMRYFPRPFCGYPRVGVPFWPR